MTIGDGERTLFGGAETGLPELFLKDTMRILKQGRMTRHVWFMSADRPRMFADCGKKPYTFFHPHASSLSPLKQTCRH